MNEHINIIPNKCKACHRCEAACITTHHNMSIKDAMKNRIYFAARAHVINKDGLKSSIHCRQCENAPCCNICPTGALKQGEDGAIHMDKTLCVACEMCLKACPYGVIELETVYQTPEENDVSGPACVYPCRVMPARCDVCKSWRIKNGKKVTACMEACPVRALVLVQEDGSIIEMPAPAKKSVPPKGESGKEIPAK